MLTVTVQSWGTVSAPVPVGAWTCPKGTVNRGKDNRCWDVSRCGCGAPRPTVEVPPMIHRTQLHQTNSTGYEADASDLGLKPGEWPELLETALGDFKQIVPCRGEAPGFAIYASLDGRLTLRVYND
jgi:hypothetical protein